MSEDLTFITNEGEKKLVDRFSTLINDTNYFDCLVGYFYISGFHELYHSLESAERIRILIGLSTNQKTFEYISKARKPVQKKLNASYKETKDQLGQDIVEEMDSSNDSIEVEDGARKFIEWIQLGKLEIKAYPEEKIHAKLYIMTFREGDRDRGRVITGSSNFTKSGLRDNIEFNVELKNRADYDFALDKFNELWDRSVDVTQESIDTIRTKTWLNDEISPYELYLKFLYEYLKEKINLDKDELYETYLPENYMELEYQKDAVKDAKMKLEEYGGVFISDVVGLGKTYISALLAQQLDGRSLVIAPPVLIDKDNPGSWRNVFFDFGVRQTEFESIGKLDKILNRGVEKYKNIFIDEAHRFRTETTQMYENLFKICRGKRVILVSATPLNNKPRDILSQIKLFQNAHNSTLPNPKVRDLEKYFKELEKRLNGLDRQKDKDEYLRIVKENAEDIRENVLQYLMVRRTRNSVLNYYGKDLEKQKLKFPEVEDPMPVIYNFDENLDQIFNQTVELIVKDFRYSRYTPFLYLKKGISQLEEASQKNMGSFMKILLLKRLESSFYAFKESVKRFIHSYKRFIEEYENGNVYISKKDINKIFDLLERDDDESIQKLLDSDRAEIHSSEEFDHKFIDDLRHDYDLLNKIKELWKDITYDPKIDRLVEILSNDRNLKKNKIIIFTESSETADFIEQQLILHIDKKTIAFSGHSSESIRSRIIENFDANYTKSKQKDDIRILVSTDVLSEGVSLHRSNVVIDYDIPWNPVKMMQRVGRVNRVSKNPPFDKIYTYNFFPAGPINENIGLKEAAESKIEAFIEMLGNDAKLLSDEEIKSHDLFMKLTSKKVITGEEEEGDSELKYLNLLRDIRDNQTEVFEKIKHLPKKARTAKIYDSKNDSLISFFRKGKLRKIYISDKDKTEELDFFNAVKIFETEEKTKKERIGNDYYKLLELNKEQFDDVFSDDEILFGSFGSRSYESRLLKIIKAIIEAPALTDEDQEYLHEVLKLLKEGGLPKSTIKKIVKKIENNTEPVVIYSGIKSMMDPNLFQSTYSKRAADIFGPKEVILSEYLLGINGDR